MKSSNRKFAALLLAGIGLTAALQAAEPVPASANGPAADYPVTIGDPYTVAGTSYTPADVWNYDQVGAIAPDPAGGGAISGSHHTLPIPSYVEVTSLDTGRTILVRLERRGPMNGNQLIGLSPGAIAQLGASPSTLVRVRRVNPPEPERAALRAGQSAPLRMDTPMSLVNVLRLKLPGAGPVPMPSAPPPLASAAVPPSNAGGAPSTGSEPLALPPLDGRKDTLPRPVGTAAPKAPPARPAPPLPAPVPTAAPKPAPKPVTASAAKGTLVVQAGAFSTRERAERVAKAIGGTVSPAGKLFRVRVGPFATRQQAEASLAKVKAAGYSDARIY
ncbi:MAG: SPOR domain-containing protein [Novosphingobium sp.]|nr:SPOR domain-containing protein [Novosphingobium sp.]